MHLHGQNFLGSTLSAEGAKTFPAINPVTSEALAPEFHEANADEIGQAADLASASFEDIRELPPQRFAGFLDGIGEEILKLGEALIERAHAETGLPQQRLLGERARTIGQIKMFAALVREGSWVEACIDRAMLDRKPLPKPDLRRMLVPVGPVAIFGASNFPLAFSVAGGDTASALAAGNPVIVKAHPAHPGTSELMARAIFAAAAATQMPDGIFSMLHGFSPEMSLQLVTQPEIKAVGFTGSLRAGRALFDAAAGRPEPIPVYAEMGSTNPVFILPGAMKERGHALAEGLIQSVTLGVGQFCTNPGLVFGVEGGSLNAFMQRAAELASLVPPGTMLHQGICNQFHSAVEHVRKIPGVRVIGQSGAVPEKGQASAIVLTTNITTFLESEHLKEELFGPSTLIVSCASPEELEGTAAALPGQLTASIHGTEEDLAAHSGLVSILKQKAGRLVFNGFPTGVEVCPSMHHGGPYPATTDVHFTSVGTAAIKRFARPVCFQNFPQSALPPELQDRNIRNLWRLVDGQMTKDDC